MKLSKISYFSFTFRLNEKNKAPLKKIGLEMGGGVKRKYFKKSKKRLAQKERVGEKIEEGCDPLKNYGKICFLPKVSLPIF